MDGLIVSTSLKNDRFLLKTTKKKNKKRKDRFKKRSFLNAIVFKNDSF